MMKNFLFLVVLFISCKKDPVKEDMTAIKVSDSITGTPVAGATLVLFRCGSFGCAVSSKTIFSGKTDNNGMVNVPSLAYNDILNELYVARPDYLDFQTQRSTTLLLRPRGWLRLRIIKTGIYPAGSRLAIDNPFNPYTLLANAAADSVLLMSGGGGVSNNMTWRVINQQGQVLNQGAETVQLPRLDTANLILNY